MLVLPMRPPQFWRAERFLALTGTKTGGVLAGSGCWAVVRKSYFNA